MNTSNHKKYDELNTIQSTLPLKYKLNPIFTEVPKPKFSSELGPLSKQGISYITNKYIIDIESELFGINTKSITDKNQNLKHFTECDMSSEHCRVFNSSFNNRIININRCLPVLKSNEKEIDALLNINISNTRLSSKDNHVTIYPKLLDQTHFLPV